MEFLTSVVIFFKFSVHLILLFVFFFFDSSFCFFNIQFSAQTLSEACLLMNMFITCILMSCILKLGCFVVLFLLSVFFMFLSWLVLPPSMLGSFY